MINKNELRIPDYLQHIIKAITQIENYTAGVDQSAFLESQLLQDAVIRNVEIIGEAANNILQRDPAFSQKHPKVELKAAYGMRNSLAHGYFNVDPALVWGTVQTDVPVLKKQVADVLRDYFPQKQSKGPKPNPLRSLCRDMRLTTYGDPSPSPYTLPVQQTA